MAELATAAGSRSMKRNLEMAIEVYNNKMKKEQHHTTDEKPYVNLNYLMNEYFEL